MFKEYNDIFCKYSNIYGNKVTVLMEVGKFYELYSIENKCESNNENSIHYVANLLNIQVSKKNKNIENVSSSNPYMAGFPSQTLTKFLNILIENQYNVVIVDQIMNGKDNIKREVSSVISPSTYTNNLISYDSNYIMSVYMDSINCFKTKSKIYDLGVSVIDLSTGANYVFNIQTKFHNLNEELNRLYLQYNVKELLLLSKDDIDLNIQFNCMIHNKLGQIEKQYLDVHYHNKMIEKVFKPKVMLSPIEYINLEFYSSICVSYCVLLQFVYEHNEKLLINLHIPEFISQDDCLYLGNDCVQQLNIIGSSKCLLNITNNCITHMGKRRFKYLLLNPISNVETLNSRYDDIDQMIRNDKCDEISCPPNR